MKPLLYFEILFTWCSSIARCDTAFDYVIAGAGTCGLVLANRLSEDPHVRVAVIEAGDDVRNNPNVTEITAFGNALNTPIAWQYSTVPQVKAGNKSIAYYGGKAIGGTSTINGKFLHSSGRNPAQAAVGASYSPQYHGENGPLKTGFPFQLTNSSLHDFAQGSWENMGYPVNHDVNSGYVHGFSVWPQTIDRDANIREDAARAFFHPVEDRPNLHILKGTVRRITWADYASPQSDITACGVEYLTPENHTITLKASKEVILSAGSLRTPMILERSGIGNPAIISQLGIDTTVELPGVGENLQDQPNVALIYAGKTNVTGVVPYATFVNAYDIFGSKTASVADTTNASLSNWALVVQEASGGAMSRKVLERLFRIQHDLIFKDNVTIGEILTNAAGSNFISVFWFLLPFSRGSVHLTETEAVDQPAIDPKFFLIDFDLALQIELGRISQQFWYTSPVDSLVASGTTELPLNASDAEWLSYFNASC
ncbi:hypothetical protein SLS62_002950 [Diatrype stigma]|uniref:Glucose-methanol-choline oxidoreductase N-terminal domain-containing protein n=1 Tax=Diatrype stigma TaxID=117547 RepID=A0AAN9YV78_9PEZI